MGEAPSVASPKEETRARAQGEMEKGVADLAAGDAEGALRHFREAQGMIPNANLPHRYAAEALVALRRYDEAVASYESYLRIKPDVRDAAEVKQRIEEIRAKHIEGKLSVRCLPPGSSVFLDDAVSALGQTPIEQYPLRAGPHTIRVRRQGYDEAVLETRVVPGTVVEIECELRKTPALPSVERTKVARPAPAEASPSSRPQAAPWYKNGWVFAGTGAAVVLTVGAIVLLNAQPTNPPATRGGTVTFP